MDYKRLGYQKLDKENIYQICFDTFESYFGGCHRNIEALKEMSTDIYELIKSKL